MLKLNVYFCAEVTIHTEFLLKFSTDAVFSDCILLTTITGTKTTSLGTEVVVNHDMTF